MGRLIDADALIEICNARIEGNESLGNYNRADEIKIMKQKIESMPTAFILERVLLQLKEAETNVSNLGHYAIHTDDAIKIVLKGGV